MPMWHHSNTVRGDQVERWRGVIDMPLLSLKKLTVGLSKCT